MYGTTQWDISVLAGLDGDQTMSEYSYRLTVPQEFDYVVLPTSAVVDYELAERAQGFGPEECIHTMGPL